LKLFLITGFVLALASKTSGFVLSDEHAAFEPIPALLIFVLHFYAAVLL